MALAPLVYRPTGHWLFRLIEVFQTVVSNLRYRQHERRDRWEGIAPETWRS